MNSLRVGLWGILLIPTGALLFSEAWSQPSPAKPPAKANNSQPEDQLRAKIESVTVAPVRAPIDLKKSRDEIYRIVQKYADDASGATKFSIVLPTLSPSQRYIDTSPFLITKMWRKEGGKWVLSKDKALMDECNEAGSMINVTPKLVGRKWFLKGQAFAPARGVWKLQIEGDLKMTEYGTWIKRHGTCDFTLEVRNTFGYQPGPEVIKRLTPKILRLEWRQGRDSKWQTVNRGQKLSIPRTLDNSKAPVELRPIPDTSDRQWPLPYVFPKWEFSQGEWEAVSAADNESIALPNELIRGVNNPEVERIPYENYSIRALKSGGDAIDIRVIAANTMSTQVSVLPDPTPTPVPTPTPFPTPVPAPTPIPTPPTIIPQTFASPMDVYLIAGSPSSSNGTKFTLWLDDRQDTSRIQQFFQLGLNARPSGQIRGTQTGNLKLRWHTSGGELFQYGREDPSQRVTTDYSDLDGRSQIFFGARKAGRYSVYAEVLRPDGKVHATSNTVSIEVKKVGNKVEILYGQWKPVEEEEDLYSRKIWAYYFRDNEDIADNVPNTPLRLSVELYDESPVPQKVTWLDKTQVTTPQNNAFQPAQNEDSQPMATQFFRYDPTAFGQHDLNAYFVKGVKK